MSKLSLTKQLPTATTKIISKSAVLKLVSQFEMSNYEGSCQYQMHVILDEANGC